MTKEEMKNRISFALKDPILQQGFEIICKENAELKEKLEATEQNRDYWKDSSFDWRHKCTSRKPFKAAVKAQKQLTKAKEIIANILTYFPDYKVKTFDDMSLLNALDKAEQFLKEVENA